MVERERINSAHITPSAHHIGYIRSRRQLTELAFVTVFGRRVHGLVAPINQGAQLSFGLSIEDFLLQGCLMIDARLTQAVEREGVIQVVKMARGLSPRGRRFQQRYSQLRYLEADLPPMATRKAALLHDQGWPGSRHAVAAVDILAEDGKRGPATLFTGFDRERPLMAITEGLVNYFQRPVIGAFWGHLAVEPERFPQGTYLADLYPNLREYPCYRQIRWGVGTIGRLMRGNYPLYYRDAAEIEAAFARCSFASTPVLDPRREGTTLGLPQGRLPSLVRVIRNHMVQSPFRRPPLVARRRGGQPVRRWPPDRGAER